MLLKVHILDPQQQYGYDGFSLEDGVEEQGMLVALVRKFFHLLEYPAGFAAVLRKRKLYDRAPFLAVIDIGLKGIVAAGDCQP